MSLFDFFKRKQPQQPQPQIINYYYQQQPQPQPQPAQIKHYTIDAQRQKIVEGILEGGSYFVILHTGQEVFTACGGISREAFATGLKQIALKDERFKTDLLNVVIDLNTETHL